MTRKDKHHTAAVLAQLKADTVLLQEHSQHLYLFARARTGDFAIDTQERAAWVSRCARTYLDKIPCEK